MEIFSKEKIKDYKKKRKKNRCIALNGECFEGDRNLIM